MVPSVATEKKSPVTPPGIDPETVRLIAQCRTIGPDYIMRVTTGSEYMWKEGVVA